jgi:LuxR family maltose regulon positive regulatory protein
MTLLATKLHMPVLRTKRVLRPRLIERLDAGAHCALTLVSAPAGFGKTTVVSEWVAGSHRPAAWLSLDADDSDPARFLSYFIAALQEIHPNIGHEVLRAVSMPQPPPIDALLAPLINEIAGLSAPFTLVLDDYHAITSPAIDAAMALLLERAPAPLHIVIVTREDPDLPLHRLRARGQLSEVRVADLRFTTDEAAGFLTHTMALRLSSQDIAALETRTEGWVAGLQLAALSMQGVADTAGFIKTFAGSHRYILDYLLEEVLHKQPEPVQDFLLRTSILGRLCGALCDALLDAPAGSSQAMLESLEQANLFITALDNERKWFRYHHLFGELLQQRLQQRFAASPDAGGVNALHLRASQWFEDNGFDLEAFHHAAAGHDIDRAERLIDGKTIPLHFRGAATAILNWLASLPAAVMNDRPALWWRHAALLLVNGHTIGVEERLNAAEKALQGIALDGHTRNLIGRIATARATLALTHYQVDDMLAQSQRALEFLHPDSLSTRANVYWVMGYAHFLRKDYAASRQGFTDAIALGQAAGAIFSTILAITGLGNVQEVDNQLHLAAQTYRRVLEMTGDQPLQIIYDAHLGLARVHYEWNELDAAVQHGEQSLRLARQYDTVIDRFIVCEVFLAQVKLARGDAAGADKMLANAYQVARQKQFVQRIPEVAAAHVPVLLRLGRQADALRLAQTHALSLSEALVYLAMGDAMAALPLLDAGREKAMAQGWADELLDITVLHAVALHMQGDQDMALQRLGEALTMAEPERFIRTFVDKGQPMAQLLAEARTRGIQADYAGLLLAAFDAEPQTGDDKLAQLLVEPLSPREIEVLRLIAQGLSNNDISERLFLALDTVKGHNRKIFEKLGVQRRTEAVARARDLGLL